jgi:hypothetical protein
LSGAVKKLTRKSIATCLVVLTFLCVGNVSAQKKGKPNFTGTWVFDEDKSRGPFDLTLDKHSDLFPDQKKTDILIIEHTEQQLGITEKRLIENIDSAGISVNKEESILSRLNYFTDKRGENNVYHTDGLKQWSITNWSGNDIRVSLTQGKKKNATIMIFSLSNGGKELVVKNMIYEIKVERDERTGATREFSVMTAAGGKKVYNKVE